MVAKPDYYQYEEYQNRVLKLEEIRELGINPYPHKYSPTDTAADLAKRYEKVDIGDSEKAAQGTTPIACIAGRLVLFRAMGKNAFAHIQDHTDRIQVMFNRDLTQVEGYNTESSGSRETLTPMKFIEKKLDLGDIVGIEGHLFYTHKGELTLFVKKLTLLCKTLLPLADKHSGLHDKELRYRKRWLDLISHQDVRRKFEQRSQILRIIRDALEELDFIEVETPVLQTTYGGAEARPFKTTLNALSQEMFMRISLEIQLKKLVVGGLDRIYEIGKVFRNEGIDRTHNPEFTMLEAYAAYWDYNDMMVFVEKLFERIAIELFGTPQVPFSTDGQNVVMINMEAPWKRLSMKDSIKTYGNIDVDAMSDEALQEILIKEVGADPLVVKKLPRGLLIRDLFEAKVEHHLVQPHHIIDHPVETTPLCKPHRDPKRRAEGLVERFETYILGNEICNAYSELNDPEMQRLLLENQALQKEPGAEEIPPIDEEFLEAICQGLPPTGGVGIGIDRMVMIFNNAEFIRDVLYFPYETRGVRLSVSRLFFTKN